MPTSRSSRILAMCFQQGEVGGMVHSQSRSVVRMISRFQSGS